MSPTHVGMDRCTVRTRCGLSGEPHARGDGPRGLIRQPRFHPVSPTHVGMDRRASALATSTPGEPHARGDGPWVTSRWGVPKCWSNFAVGRIAKKAKAGMQKHDEIWIRYFKSQG